MAKKNNKTEQVLKIITGEGEEERGEQEAAAEEVVAAEVPSEETQAEAVPALDPSLASAGVEPLELEQAVSSLTRREGESQTHARPFVINLTEYLVRENALVMMGKLDMCQCDTCYLDVLALTLNSLPNKFITTNAGKQHLQLDIYKKQYETDIVSALARACVRVKSSPRHGEGEK